MRRFYRNAYLALGATLLLLAAFGLASACSSPKTPLGSWHRYPDASTAYYETDAGYFTWTPASSSSARRFAAVPASWQWVTPVIDADHGSLATGTGYLYDLHCVLTALAAEDAGGTTPLYVMGFDSSSSAQPINGTVPLFGIVSGGLVSLGNDVSYADEQYAHGVVLFTSGLLVALSTTADTFTAPAAGNQVRCDAKLSGRR